MGLVDTNGDLVGVTKNVYRQAGKVQRKKEQVVVVVSKRRGDGQGRRRGAKGPCASATTLSDAFPATRPDDSQDASSIA